jgi:hypothetical protein
MEPALGALLALSTTVLLIALYGEKRKQRIAEFEAEELRLDNASLQQRVDRLSPYADVADAVDEAAKIRAQASAEAQKLRQETAEDVARRLAQSATEAAQAKIETREYLKKRKAQAEGVIERAQESAAFVVNAARKRAEAIAGDALRAMEKADQWVGIERAMRNVVKGYGDAYLIPPYHLLDELSDNYDHKEAGRQLKLARDRTRDMIKHGRAAQCDYKENRRKGTAVRFVTDAFNGKVDVILARVKADNAGTLEQKIRDAAALVNKNGEAFRKARITPEYLDARLEELKWGASTYLLRDQERAEQREIKARIREEERARREYERALKKAAKDQDTLRKAMEVARSRVADASEVQKAKYEQRLAELMEKLREAEERSKRATSMAQLTRSGHVYIISNIGSFGDNVFKIGMTRRLEPLDRVRELGDASVPFRFDVHAMMYSEDAPLLENALHHRFAMNQVNKMNARKEFFRVPLRDLREVIEELKIEVHWTMSAEALEYRETKALEATMASNEATREDWLRRQRRWDSFVEVFPTLGEAEDPAEIQSA